MKKKIRDLMDYEIQELMDKNCDLHIKKQCQGCPLDIEDQCLWDIKDNILNKEIEVEEDE